MYRMYEDVDQHELNKIVSSWDVVLLKFGAPWCPPCKTLDQTLWALVDETEGFAVAKVDVDNSPELASEYGIMGVPTIFVLKNGEVKDKVMGAHSLATLKALVEGVK